MHTFHETESLWSQNIEMGLEHLSFSEPQKCSRKVLLLVHRKFLYVKDLGQSDKNIT
jgi:hypothetical protein